MTALAKAKLSVTGQPDLEVQFNPVSLQVEITNSITEQGNGATRQISTQSSAKMGLDLVFDSTTTGADVREKTRKLMDMVRPAADPSNAHMVVPPVITFTWGTFSFKGIAESFREAIDFFSPEGVPLRSQVNMSLKQQQAEFTSAGDTAGSSASASRAFEVPAALRGAAGVASAGGDIRAARGIASANGELSLRFSAGGSMAVSAGVNLRPAVAMTSSAGLPSSAPALRFNAGSLATAPASPSLATDSGAGFGVDGRALPAGGSGLRADVGQGSKLSSRLRFDS
jgi:hypothetical protein